METQMTSKEIGVLLMKAQRSASAVRMAEGNSEVLQFDLNQSGQLSNEQTECVSTLHKNLALRLSEALSAFLRTAVEFKLESIAQVPYEDFLKQQTDPAYLASVRIPSFDVFSMLQADFSVVFPLVDM